MFRGSRRGLPTLQLRRAERAPAASARLHPERHRAHRPARRLARAKSAASAPGTVPGRVIGKTSTRSTHPYVKPVNSVTGIRQRREDTVRQVLELLAPDRFPPNSPGLAPGIFLACA